MVSIALVQASTVTAETVCGNFNSPFGGSAYISHHIPSYAILDACLVHYQQGCIFSVNSSSTDNVFNRKWPDTNMDNDLTYLQTGSI
jgi:hypothetical protein